jgi:hypothetical protein
VSAQVVNNVVFKYVSSGEKYGFGDKFLDARENKKHSKT